MNNVIKRVWNQNRMVAIEDLKGMTFQAESGGHTFQISGVDDAGNTVALSGSVAGVFLRPDNTDVAITGSASGGVVSVTLPANCYDVPGRFGLTIFVTSNGQKTAVYAAMGTVSRTSSGTVSPGTTSDVVDLINRINAAVATIPANWTGLMADIAPTYSDAAVYPVGAYVYYNGDLYRCITAITTAESWTAGHWTQAVLGNDVSDLKSAIGDYTYDSGYRICGTIGNPIGALTTNANNHSILLSVLPGQKIDIMGSGGNNARLWATADSNMNVVRNAAANSVQTENLTLTIEEGESYFVWNSTNLTYNPGYCKIKSLAELSDLTITSVLKNKSDIKNNGTAISKNAQSVLDIIDAINTEKIPYINAYTKSLSTTNYIAIVVPSTYLSSVDLNDIEWKCYCEDTVTAYWMLNDVDLTQTGNNRITTKLVGQSYATNIGNGWHMYKNANVARLTPTGDYIAFVLNVVPTDSVKRRIKAYFKDIKINGVLLDTKINQVFLYSASPTASDEVGETDAGIITISEKLNTALDLSVGNGKILCIGDSLTAGVYASDSQIHAENYPYYMKRLVSNEVLNKGMPGYSASMYWNNSVLSASDFVDVKHIIIMLGTNGGLTDTLEEDVYPYDDYHDYASGKTGAASATGCYCKIIEYCMEQAPNAEIYLCTTPFYNKDIVPQFAPPTTPDANIVIPKIAEHYNFSMIDVRHGMGINQKNTLVFQSDGLHGDSGFYQKLGTFIGSQLKAKASFII